MKKTLISLCLLFGIFCFSQNTTRKWNSVMERYEYFDSRGSMTGYEKYNSITKEWEYYSNERKNKYENYNKSTDDYYAGLNSDQDQTIAYLRQLQQSKTNQLRNYVSQLENEVSRLVQNAQDAQNNKNYSIAAEYLMTAYEKQTSIYQNVTNKDYAKQFIINYLYGASANYTLAGNYTKAINLFEYLWNNFDFNSNKIDISIKIDFHVQYSAALYYNKQYKKAIEIAKRGLRYSPSNKNLLNIKEWSIEEGMTKDPENTIKEMSFAETWDRAMKSLSPEERRILFKGQSSSTVNTSNSKPTSTRKATKTNSKGQKKSRK